VIDILANGVWSVDFDEAVKIKDARGDTIATLAQTFLRGRRSASEVTRNAHLIAAAPELLEALKAIMSPGMNGPESLPIWKKAEAAIAKAEGGAA
jgi:hypothetical protein